MNQAKLRPHRGDLVLNLSILSLYFFPLGILAWFLGARDLAAMQAGTVDPAGRGTIQCARFIGSTSALLNLAVLGLVLIVALAILFGLHAVT